MMDLKKVLKGEMGSSKYLPDLNGVNKLHIMHLLVETSKEGYESMKFLLSILIQSFSWLCVYLEYEWV